MRSSSPSTPPGAKRAAAAARVAYFAAAAIAASALIASCPAPARTIIALDEAFTASRPGLSARIQGGWALREGLFGKPLVLPVALTESAGKALDAAIAEGKKGGNPVVLATSPLVAKAIVGGGTWSGDPPLLVPEWRGSPSSGLWTASTDSVPAYRAAGSAAGAFIAALTMNGGSPSCGVVFSEAPSRPRAALAAFAAGYAESSEGRPLNIREIDEGNASSPSEGKALQSSGSGAAEAAVADLLRSDARVLFIALGPHSEAAIKAAERPGLAVGADFPYPETSRSLAFRIAPDDSALVRALASELRELRGRAAKSDARAIPALLSAGPRAGSIRAGKLDFKRFLENAALRAKGSR